MLSSRFSRILAGFIVLFIVVAVLILNTIPAYSLSPVSLKGLSKDEYYMVMAFAEIGKHVPEEGWPVGAVVVQDDKIVGRAANMLFVTNDPTQHAEYIAIDRAIATITRQARKENYADFFKDATIYVTLEPCPMDAGKITMLRFKRVVICDVDEIWGAFGSVSKLTGYPHEVIVEKSSLPLCQHLREVKGWNDEELWQYGKLYAVSTNQVPKLLTFFLKKIKASVFSNHRS